MRTQNPEQNPEPRTLNPEPVKLGVVGAALCLVLAVAAIQVTAAGQLQPPVGQAPAAGQFQPQVGQPGKDVVWVPTADVLVAKMLDMAGVTPNDYVIDLGSGDGRTVIAATKRGARALGIEYNPDMVELSRQRAVAAGVAGQATFVKADLFETDFSRATVITMFLLPDINLRLRPKILDLTPGTRVVSNTFTMGEWTPDETATVRDEGCTTYCTALLWIVPAKVEGLWRFSDGQVTLAQSFQMVGGTLAAHGISRPITNGRVRGDRISFVVGATEYSGRVTGDTIEGTLSSDGAQTPWHATRGR
jgi:SAM-dependent methyltransferase